MISERKTLHGMLRASVLLICIFTSISLCTAQQKDDTQLIELMDVMLEDFLNPRQSAPIVEQKPRILQDSAIPMESAPITSSTLPQASSPSMPVHVPLAEDYSYTEPKQQTQTVPSQSVTTPQQYSQPEYTQVQPLPQTQPVYSQPQHTDIQPVYTQTQPYTQPAQTQPVQPQYTQPQPSYTQLEPDYVDIEPIYTQPPVQQSQPQYTQTQPVYTPPVQTQPAQPQYTQTQPAQEQTQTVQLEQLNVEPESQNEKTEVAATDTSAQEGADDEEFGDIVFTDEMLQENYFQPVNTLTANIEYNSYNSKFKTLGGSVMFDHALRQNSALGVLGGGYIDFSDGFKLKGLDFAKIILEAEIALFYRHYIMSDSMKAKHPYGWGFYLQPELGAAVAFNKTGLIKDQLGLKVSPLGSLRVGWRAYIKKSPLYIEPFLRVGYPFVAGGGIGFGLQL